MKNEKSIDRNHNVERRNLEDTGKEETRRLSGKTNVFLAKKRKRERDRPDRLLSGSNDRNNDVRSTFFPWNYFSRGGM